MFTGLIEEVGEVISVKDSRVLKIGCNKILKDVQLGDSISVNGVCLTVVEFQDRWFRVDVSEETNLRWNQEKIRAGISVNLERSLAVGQRMGGHFVSGHVDGKGRVVCFEPRGDFHYLRIQIPEELNSLVVEKGSIAIDGISLTINGIQGNEIELMIVPHTLEQTNMGILKVDDRVNIEVDMLGKYVQKQLSGYTNHDLGKQGNLDLNHLAQMGYEVGTNE